MNASRKQHGFTIIELMVTMAIIAILVAVALPAYNGATRKAARSEAKAVLMNMVAKQQQMLLDTRSYADTLAKLKITVPPSVSSRYDFTVTLGTAVVPGFTATATPKGDQTQDTCPALTINEQGVKLPANCW